jgi:hypothetical protein
MALPAHSSTIFQSRRPLWVQTQEKVAEWLLLGESPFLCRAIKYGIYERPTIPFVSGEVMKELPQTAEDLEFGIADLSGGCEERICEEISRQDANSIRAKGCMIASAFSSGRTGQRVGRAASS